MATFLNTSATNYYLEELIKTASERVVLISPYLKLNDRVKELLEDKDRLKIDVRIVYGKSELQPAEINWLKELTFVRTSFCKNLHAKCYISEDSCIISSLNLYEFSQVNNNEMGVLINRQTDAEMYKDAYEEAQRIIRISEEVRISLETVNPETEKSPAPAVSDAGAQMLTTSRLAKQLGMSTKDLSARLLAVGWIQSNGDSQSLTASGVQRGGEAKTGRYGDYILWPASIEID